METDKKDVGADLKELLLANLGQVKYKIIAVIIEYNILHKIKIYGSY
jgi:hypothetical protein